MLRYDRSSKVENKNEMHKWQSRPQGAKTGFDAYLCSVRTSVIQLSGTNEKALIYGGVAQLGEHLPCKQGVKGSIPFISTTGKRRRQTRGKLAKIEAHHTMGSRSETKQPSKSKHGVERIPNEAKKKRSVAQVVRARA